MTSHHLKWCPLPPNEVRWIAQHVRKEKEEKYGEINYLLLHIFYDSLHKFYNENDEYLKKKENHSP